MEQYTKIYSEVTELTYNVEAKDIKLICIIKKNKLEYFWSVYLEDHYDIFKWKYDVELFHTTAHSLERCIDSIEFFISKNFKVE